MIDSPVEWEWDREPDWQSRGGVYIDGHGLGSGYRWLLSFYVLGIHVAVGRSAYTSPFPHRRVWCLLHGGHRREDNNLSDPSRRYYCPTCGTVWPE